MADRLRLHSAFGSDMGRRRTNNEDRYFVDADNGIFAVIDGVGGHAAGEHAAETAREVIRERLMRPTGSPEERLREAITLANNEIFRLARSTPDWSGMACVLTVALIEDGVVTVGHVGDSRLYLLQPGRIEKVTHDHSPVGEREDRGELDELDAMRHARRNEIFRDVGSVERVPDDPAFVEIQSFPMPDGGALLLCSDGLTDLITKEEIRAGLERYAPDYEAAIAALIDAANHAGGKDNITVVVVATPDYTHKLEMPDTTVTTRTSVHVGGRWLFGAAGLALGLLLGFLAAREWHRFAPSGPVTIVVGPTGIAAALAQAHPGDTVLIPQGKYNERVQLKEGVALRAQLPDTVTITSPDAGPAVIAQKIESGSLEGVWIQGDPQAPESAGIEIVDASVTISNDRVTGAETGIVIQGHSEPVVTSSQIESNLGAGILIESGAKPRIEHNQIAANGDGKPGIARPGVEVGETARPVLKDNAIVNNASEPVWIHGRAFQPADFMENYFGELTEKQAIRLIDPAPSEEAKPKPAKPGARGK
jgi:serine/threonine protein phosphatase PrpC/nitrous oxidase accessory protein NosD